MKSAQNTMGATDCEVIEFFTSDRISLCGCGGLGIRFCFYLAYYPTVKKHA